MAKSILRARVSATHAIRVKPGEKVKVYSGNRVSTEVIRFGEVIGIRQRDGKLLLNERPDFKGLSIREFNHCREGHQVVFMNSIPEAHWNPMMVDVQGVKLKGKEVNNG